MAGRAVARDPKEIVARGYDAIALRYAAWAGRVEAPTLEWLRSLDARLPDGANVLELGSGPLILTVSALKTHKNLKTLICAMPAVRRDVPDAVLAMPGNPNDHQAELERLAQRIGVEEAVGEEISESAG